MNTTEPGTTTAGVALDVEGLTVRFGGAVAVHDVSLQAPTGRITGLIGPNGAGKTTTFNACAGVIKADHGSVRLFGENVGHLGPAARAQRGLGRTFQRMQLFGSLPVAVNVALGREAGLASSSALRQLFSRPGDRDRVAEAVEEALNLCGLTAIADRRVGTLSTGQRRLVELARAYAGGFPLLLLDEPSSGLDDRETERFAAILRTIMERRRPAVLLVEHDMSLVMRVCEYLYVLDFGELLFEGTPEQTLASEVVRSAYLGAEEGLEAAERQAGAI
jgi:ABC-type branched-subunit amino acid transport system ATPase component